MPVWFDSLGRNAYHAVLHLAEDNLDSTSNAYDGINVGTVDAAGLIGGGLLIGLGVQSGQ